MTPNGQQVCSLRVATSESYQKDGQREEKTEWHSVVLWGRLAELASKYLRKGRSCYIEGRIQTRSWDDKDGQKRYKTEIVANQLQFIDSGAGKQGEAGDMPADTSESYGGGGGHAGNGGAPSSGGYNQSQPSYEAPQSRPVSSGNSYKAPDIDEDVPF